jgi:hypothetical protein
MCNNNHGTIAMNCDVILEHFIILKLYYKIQCSNVATKFDVHQTIKKRKKRTMASIVDFFSSEIFYKKTNHTQKHFCKDLVFYITFKG